MFQLFYEQLNGDSDVKAKHVPCQLQKELQQSVRRKIIMMTMTAVLRNDCLAIVLQTKYLPNICKM